MTEQEKFDMVVQEAETNFWITVQKHFPAVKYDDGDISQDTIDNVRKTMQETLAEWVDNN